MSPSQISLRISEIFYSLQGESTTVGRPTVFVRLTGCPLRCGYCDTSYAFTGGKSMSLDEVMDEIAQYDTSYVCVTGGEPLAQKYCNSLLKHLCERGYRVSLETSGALDISQVDPGVKRIMDFKTPGSGECERNLYSNIEYLKSTDEVKFVICDREDYDWAKQQVMQYGLVDICEVLFSPAQDRLQASTLADWILADQLNVRFQVQLHKYLWGNEPGR